MTLSVPLVALAGVVSFASPCFLPVVPAYLGLVAGNEQQRASHRLLATARAGAFVAGFTVVFTALWVSLGLVGHALADHRDVLRILGGAVLIVLGLHVTGAVNLGVLSRQFRATPKVAGSRPGLGTAFVLGLAFGAGWTPCVGPILGGVIGLASTSGSVAAGAVLLLVYSLGLGIPFILVAVGADFVSQRLGGLRRHQRTISWISGGFLVVLGFLMVTDRFARLAALVPGL